MFRDDYEEIAELGNILREGAMIYVEPSQWGGDRPPPTPIPQELVGNSITFLLSHQYSTLIKAGFSITFYRKRKVENE